MRFFSGLLIWDLPISANQHFLCLWSACWFPHHHQDGWAQVCVGKFCLEECGGGGASALSCQPMKGWSVLFTYTLWFLITDMSCTTRKLIHHDDIVGEEVDSEERDECRKLVLASMVGEESGFNRFPGSQPVSLDRTNLPLLKDKRWFLHSVRHIWMGQCRGQIMLCLNECIHQWCWLHTLHVMLHQVLGDLEGWWHQVYVTTHGVWCIYNRQKIQLSPSADAHSQVWKLYAM